MTLPDPVQLLGRLCRQVRGVSYSGGEAVASPTSGYLPILRANNICSDGSLRFEDLVYVPRNRISESQLLQPNDIVVAASSGSLDVVGKAAQCTSDWEGSFGAFCKVLRPDCRIVDPNYLRYYFRTRIYRHKVSQLAAGANINNLRNEHLDNLEVPLPPLAEQRRIAAILDKADAVRRKRQQAIALADQFLKSAFLEMFGDPQDYAIRFRMQRLCDVCEKITDGEHGTVKRLEAGRRYLMARNVTRDNRLDLSDVSFISESDHERIYKRCDPRLGDLLLVCVGATIGKVALVPAIEEFSLARSVALIKPHREHLLPSYLLHLFSSKYVQHMLIGGSNVSAQAGLYLSKLRDLEVPVPGLDLQEGFGIMAARIQKQKSHQAKYLAEADCLFNSLVQRAFRGELTTGDAEAVA